MNERNLSNKVKNAVLVFIGQALDNQFNICATAQEYEALKKRPITIFKYKKDGFFINVKLNARRGLAVLQVSTPAIDVEIDFDGNIERDNFVQIMRESWDVALDSKDFTLAMTGIFRAIAGWKLAKPGYDFALNAGNIGVKAIFFGSEIELRLLNRDKEITSCPVFVAGDNGVNLHEFLKNVLNCKAHEAFDLLHAWDTAQLAIH